MVVTGIGTVDCARHDMKRPRGIGDLQKGERSVIFNPNKGIFTSFIHMIYRYINMDFFFFSTLSHIVLRLLVVSYDIACQWSRNFHTRMAASFPESWPINQDKVNIRFLIPKFHLPAHIEKCHRDFSFNFTKGVGRTDGEAPERGWSGLNDLAHSTREMGPGSRQDTIEDHIGDRNWTKVVNMGATLLRKIEQAISERAKSSVLLRDFSHVLDLSNVTLWASELEAWECDATKPNPFQPRTKRLFLP